MICRPNMTYMRPTAPENFDGYATTDRLCRAIYLVLLYLCTPTSFGGGFGDPLDLVAGS